MYEIGDDGYAYEIGAGEYLLGAPVRMPGRANQMARARPGGQLARAVAVKQAQSGTLVTETPPTKANELILGFDSVSTIAAAATTTVTSRPQQVFRPDRLAIPSSIAPLFLINDLRVGKNSQFLNSTANSAEVFAINAVGVRLKMDTAQINTDIVLNITNISLGASRFLASLIGPSVGL